MIPRTGHFKKHPERENYTEKKREHELAFSASPEEIMKVKKSKRTKSNKNKARNKVSSDRKSVV